MKISTKGRYGVRIMLELSLQFDKKLLTAREIARNQKISEKYVEQIISTLNKAGLVRSYRGATGGYRIAENPCDVTVGDILRATEGGLNIVGCISGDPGQQCPNMDDCVTIDVWQEIKNAIENVVDNTSLADLVTRYYEKYNFSYVI